MAALRERAEARHWSALCESSPYCWRVGRTARIGAVAGAVAPFVFLIAAIALSWLEKDFMDELGWEVWPSGLALGPHGWLQTVNFALLGALLITFALGIADVPARSRIARAAPILLGLAGGAAAALVFETDPPDVDETWHGLVHGVAYLTWLGSIVVAYPLTWLRVRRHAIWTEAPWWTSVLALLLFPPVLLLPDSESSGNYLFFAVVLTPLAAIALRLAAGARLARSDAGANRTTWRSV